MDEVTELRGRLALREDNDRPTSRAGGGGGKEGAGSASKSGRSLFGRSRSKSVSDPPPHQQPDTVLQYTAADVPIKDLETGRMLTVDEAHQQFEYERAMVDESRNYRESRDSRSL